MFGVDRLKARNTTVLGVLGTVIKLPPQGGFTRSRCPYVCLFGHLFVCLWPLTRAAAGASARDWPQPCWPIPGLRVSHIMFAAPRKTSPRVKQGLYAMAMSIRLSVCSAATTGVPDVFSCEKRFR